MSALASMWMVAEGSERVVLARLEVERAAIAAEAQILTTAMQIKMVQMLVRTAVESVALVTLGFIFARSAGANAWLQKLVSEPIKLSFTTLFSFGAVFLAPLAVWL